MPDITVSARDLSAAIRAVVPHAETNPDVSAALHRVRFTIAGDNLHVHASQGVTAGLALVSILDHGPGEWGQFDLTPGEAREVVRLFKPHKDAIEGEDGLRLEWAESEVTITDVGGLLPGKSTTWPSSLHDSYPDIEALIGTTARQHDDVSDSAGFFTAGTFLKAFAAAAEVYKEGLRLTRPGRRRVLVSCGESFLGVLLVGDAHDRHADFDERAWLARLPLKARFTPADVDVRHVDDDDDEQGDPDDEERPGPTAIEQAFADATGQLPEQPAARHLQSVTD